MPDIVTITKEEHQSLLDDRDLLGCLEEGGVDNWEGYDAAQRAYKRMKQDAK